MRDSTQSSPVCKLIVERIEESGVDAFSGHGLLDIRRLLRPQRLLTPKSFAYRNVSFPVLSFGWKPPLTYRLNTHVIFDDSLSNDSLAHFRHAGWSGGSRLEAAPFTDPELMKWANIFETRDSLHVALFPGPWASSKTQCWRRVHPQPRSAATTMRRTARRRYGGFTVRGRACVLLAKPRGRRGHL
jgi:hypothetical protein